MMEQNEQEQLLKVQTAVKNMTAAMERAAKEMGRLMERHFELAKIARDEDGYAQIPKHPHE